MVNGRAERGQIEIPEWADKLGAAKHRATAKPTWDTADVLAKFLRRVHSGSPNLPRTPGTRFRPVGTRLRGLGPSDQPHQETEMTSRFDCPALEL